MKQLIFTSIILSLFFVFNNLQAQIPQTMSYQGILQNSDGNLVTDGDYSITFSLYSSSTSNLELWTETQISGVENGILNATLGSVIPLNIMFDQPYWLGISIEGGTELRPRTPLNSSPYALNTKEIPDNIVTNEKVADGTVVRSINALTDNVTISAGSNIFISESGNDINISSYGGSVFTLPYEGSTAAVTHAFSVTNDNYGNTIYAKNTSTGPAGFFESDNPDILGGSTLFAKTNSNGTAIEAYATGGGIAGEFTIVDPENRKEVISCITHGKGIVGYFRSNNESNDKNTIHAANNGSGNTVFGYASGTGSAGYFEINNSLNLQPALYATTNGTGEVAKLVNENSSNNNEVLFAQTNGGGYAVYGENNGTTGFAGKFDISNSSNSKNTLTALTSGTGKAIYAAATNEGNVSNYGGFFSARGTTGYGIWAEATNTSGVNFGGHFSTASSSGQAIRAEATNTSGENYGGYFSAGGPTGYAIWAEATSVTGVNYGGHFTTASSSGRAIRGHATGVIGENYGGAFRADGTEGRGVWAFGQEYDFYAAGPGINYGTSSSLRWKNNIVAIDNPLEKIAQLRGVYFDWDSEHGGQHDVGMIAEEVGKVLPEIVSYEENNIDAEGMDYSKITPLLVEAIKAQQQIIEKLQKEIEALKATVSN